MNILFIMTDQQRFDAVGYMDGYTSTPNLDALRKESVLFSSCYANSPVCVPTRVSLATGLYPHNTGLWQNVQYTLPSKSKTWMRAIRLAGMRTSLFGKCHLHEHQGDLRDRLDLMHSYGLDEVDEIGGPRASARVMSNMTERWSNLGLLENYRSDFDNRYSHKPWVVRPSTLPLTEYSDVYVGSRALEYLRKSSSQKPWFCWVSFGGPHEPWDTPAPWATMHTATPSPPRESPISLAANRPLGGLDTRINNRPSLEPDEVLNMRRDYAGNVALIDDQIGRIFNLLKQKGEWENTAIIFTSDHGELNGDAGLIYKETFLDGAMRVPLLIRIPGIAEGEHTHPVEWIDIGPTIAELAGTKLDYKQYGRSLMPAVYDNTVIVRPSAISEYDGEICRVDDNYKIAANDESEVYLLFDRKNDPTETTNLAASGMQNVEKEFIRSIERFRRETSSNENSGSS